MQLVTGVTVKPLNSTTSIITVPSLSLSFPAPVRLLTDGLAGKESQHSGLNLRKLYQLGNYTSPATAEFSNAINGTTRGGRNGLELMSKRLYFMSATPENGGKYTISLNTAATAGRGTEVKLPGVSAQSLATPLTDAERQLALQYNIASFMRIAGFKSFTPAALAALAKWRFWF